MTTVTFCDERTKLVVTVRPATYRDDLARLDLQDKAAQNSTEDAYAFVAAAFTHPRLVSASPTGELVVDGKDIPWPPTVQDIMDMSVDAVDIWYEEVKRLNPKWFPDTLELEKKLKAISPLKESSPSMKEVTPKKASLKSKA